jgi:MHS family proline/betaine transporter-like MFS transporter
MEKATSESGVRTICAGAIGNVLEWYDFALFGFLAPVLSPLFFPSENRLASLLDTYGVFAIGFLMRPLGGVIFGHIGDKLSRKTALQWSVMMMALPTTAIALLPTYAQVGFLAPVLLTLIRMLQGLSVGGEYIGSMSFLAEHAPIEKRGYVASWCTFSATLGTVLGSGIAALVLAAVPVQDVAVWGWRLPFLFGLTAGLFGLWLRSGVSESPCFQKAAECGGVAHAPVLTALREDRRALLLTVGLTLMMSIGFYLPWVWLPTWMSRINTPHLPLSQALTINTVAMMAMIVVTPLAGLLSDRWGRKPVLLLGYATLALLAYPLFLLLSAGDEGLDLLALLIIAGCAAMGCGAGPAAFVELFPTQTRFSGIALGYNGAQAVFGGTTPFVATWLIESTGHPRAPAFYLVVAAALSVIAVLCMTERSRQPLT